MLWHFEALHFMWFRRFFFFISWNLRLKPKIDLNLFQWWIFDLVAMNVEILLNFFPHLNWISTAQFATNIHLQGHLFDEHTHTHIHGGLNPPSFLLLINFLHKNRVLPERFLFLLLMPIKSPCKLTVQRYASKNKKLTLRWLPIWLMLLRALNVSHLIFYSWILINFKRIFKFLPVLLLPCTSVFSSRSCLSFALCVCARDRDWVRGGEYSSKKWLLKTD